MAEQPTLEPQRIQGKMQPRGSLVLVRKHEPKEKTTKGGIFIPLKVASKGFVYATVVEVGPGRYLENGELATINLTPGDTVLMQTKNAMPLSVEERNMFLINEHDIIARIIE